MSRLSKIERKEWPIRDDRVYFKSLDDLWVMVSDAHGHLDEGNVDTKQAIAHARQACLAFLFETEP
jgi:hypothetical protein